VSIGPVKLQLLLEQTGRMLVQVNNKQTIGAPRPLLPILPLLGRLKKLLMNLADAVTKRMRRMITQ
jgi:hypothetical protein